MHVSSPFTCDRHVRGFEHARVYTSLIIVYSLNSGKLIYDSLSLARVQFRSTCISLRTRTLVTPQQARTTGICTHLLKLSTPPFSLPLQTVKEGRETPLFNIVWFTTKASKRTLQVGIFSLCLSLALALYTAFIPPFAL